MSINPIGFESNHINELFSNIKTKLKEKDLNSNSAKKTINNITTTLENKEAELALSEIQNSKSAPLNIHTELDYNKIMKLLKY